MKNPNFFIVGAPKSGTTAMYTYLKQHPSVFMSDLKELHFFGKDLHRINYTPYTLEQYLSFFDEAVDESCVGEASTSYLHSKCAAKEIKEFNSIAKIIIMLRNPADVMYAYHNTNVYGGSEYIADFETALKAEEKRKGGLCWPKTPGILENLLYREVVKYYQQVKRYLDTFGSENVHIIIFDDFKSDTKRAYKEILNFLRINHFFCPDFPIIRPDKRLTSVSFQNFLLSPPKIIQTFVHSIVPHRIRCDLVNKLRRLNQKNIVRPPMARELRKRLQAEFASEVKQLSELLGRDLTHWSKD